MKKLSATLSLLLLLFCAVVAISGCTNPSGEPIPAEPNSQISDPHAVATEKLTLYFSDDQAMFLIPETREVKMNTAAKTASTTAEAIVNELIAGPADSKLIATIPPGTKLLSLKITDEIAYVDFNEEFKTNHPGGSSGEIMTLNSIVNSLTELPEIKQVQILINGKTAETLAGHMDLSQALSRDESSIKK